MSIFCTLSQYARRSTGQLFQLPQQQIISHVTLAPFHYTNISLSQLLKPKHEYPLSRSPSTLRHCPYCSLFGLCFPLPLFFPNNPCHSYCSRTLPSPNPSCQYPSRCSWICEHSKVNLPMKIKSMTCPSLFLENQKKTAIIFLPLSSHVLLMFTRVVRQYKMH